MDVRIDLTAILIVAIVFLAMSVVVATLLYFAHRAKELRHATLRVALEKGQPLPPGLLEGRGPAARGSDLTRGTKAAFLGVGISLCLYLVRPEFWPLGLVVLFLGMGFLAAHWLSRGAAGASAADD